MAGTYIKTKENMETLAVETTTKIVSLALYKSDGGILKVDADEGGQGVVMIFALLKNLLEMGGLLIKEISRVLVNVGPGDFTGTRVGVIFSKTVSLVIGVALYGFNTLEVMASFGETSEERVMIPVLDVRRGYYYFGGFRKSRSPENNGVHRLIRVFKPELVKLDTLVSRLIEIPEEKMILIQKDQIDSNLKDMFSKIGYFESDLINAEGLITAAQNFELSNRESDPHNIFPIYPSNFEMSLKETGKS